IYIHFEDHKPYWYFGEEEIEIGFAIGFYYTQARVIPEWADAQYYGRLLSTDIMGTRKDDVYFTSQAFPSKNIKISNEDFKFTPFSAGIDAKKKNGNLVRILYWIGADALTALYADFVVNYQGVIEIIEEGPVLGLNLRDIRSSLNKKTPDRYLDTSQLSYIKDPNKEYILPQIWGKVSRIPVLCLNENVNKDIDVLPPASDTATDYEFLIGDVSTHSLASDAIKTLYIADIEINLTLPIVQVDSEQSIAKFTVPESYFRQTETDDSGTVTKVKWKLQDKVTIDIHGYLKGSAFREADGNFTTTPTDLIENGLSILREILRVSYNYSYTSTFFELTSWEAIETDTDKTYSIGLYLSKPIEVWKTVQEISKSMLGRFEWNSNLRFDFTSDDYEQLEANITKEEILPENATFNIKIDARRVLSTFRVGLDRKWAVSDKESSYEWLVDDSNKESALNEYSSTYQEDFLTLINNLTDASKYAVRILAIGGTSLDILTIKVPWRYITLKAGQWISVQLDHINEILYGVVKAQIQEVNPSMADWSILLTIRITAYYPYLTDEEGTLLTDEEGAYLIGEEEV
ncbi:MAG: hypothetical protein GWN64_07690, partial [Candidatus Thorarchaeota archaeon]|nr:hypothetical protein [Candidatus Thorarchaeota archaeon]